MHHRREVRKGDGVLEVVDHVPPLYGQPKHVPVQLGLRGVVCCPGGRVRGRALHGVAETRSLEAEPSILDVSSGVFSEADGEMLAQLRRPERRQH